MSAGTRKWLLLGPGLLAVVLLAGLGVWQVQRLAWKNALIARVEAGLAAQPVAAPGPEAWPEVTFDTAEYRRITVHGHYLPQTDILVKAVTVRGSGFWVMAPFETQDGWRLFVNRGFVPQERQIPAGQIPAGQALAEWPRPDGSVEVSGLLRLTQPDGAFLRSNDPAGGRWFSRDTAAMAQSLGLDEVAPYFLDADASSEADSLPIGGLTVVSFPNNHLQYALTWFALSGGLAFLLFWAFRKGGEE